MDRTMASRSGPFQADKFMIRAIILVCQAMLLLSCTGATPDRDVLTVRELNLLRGTSNRREVTVEGFVYWFGDTPILVPGYEGHCSSERPWLVLLPTEHVRREALTALLYRRVAVRGVFRDRRYPTQNPGEPRPVWSDDTVFGPLRLRSIEAHPETCRTN
jgi:hypothetical protein